MSSARSLSSSTALLALRRRSAGLGGGGGSGILRVLPEVSDAVSSNRPVVALESTILAHGLPHPQNLEVARELSTILRAKGVVPATIAVKDGVCRVGLTDIELSDLARAGEEGRATKCSARDLPILLAKNGGHAVGGDAHRWGATTVASTMRLAHLAGIPTFVTGGTGGVHRSGHVTLDVSADLYELSRTPVVVVSAGIKSILDVERTLEYLETLGVPVVGYGTDAFPAFFSPVSDVASPMRLDGAAEVARAWQAGRKLGMPNGMLVAVPNVDPAGEAVERAIQEALLEAKDAGIKGRDVTPHVLRSVVERTGGDSLRSNIALVKNNAEVGADIAVAIAREVEQESTGNVGKTYYTSAAASSSAARPLPPSRVLVMGGTVVDLIAKPEEGTENLIPGTSNPGSVTECDGGVGRNVAEALGRLGSNPILFTAVGDDSLGRAIADRLQDECGVVAVRDSINFVKGSSTSTYLAVLNPLGDLHTAVADTDVLAEIPIPSAEALSAADILVMDANAPVESLIEAADSAVRAGVKVFFEPTSVPKASVLGRRHDFLSHLTYAFPNVDELMAMADGWTDSPEDLDEATYDDFKTVKLSARELLEQMMPEGAHVVVTLGKDGVLLASKVGNNNSEEVKFTHFPAEDGVEVKNSTGAGDTLCGAFIHAILEGNDEATAVQLGMEAAVKSLKCSDRAISTNLGK